MKRGFTLKRNYFISFTFVILIVISSFSNIYFVAAASGNYEIQGEKYNDKFLDERVFDGIERIKEDVSRGINSFKNIELESLKLKSGITGNAINGGNIITGFATAETDQEDCRSLFKSLLKSKFGIPGKYLEGYIRDLQTHGIVLEDPATLTKISLGSGPQVLAQLTSEELEMIYATNEETSFGAPSNLITCYLKDFKIPEIYFHIDPETFEAIPGNGNPILDEELKKGAVALYYSQSNSLILGSLSAMEGINAIGGLIGYDSNTFAAMHVLESSNIDKISNKAKNYETEDRKENFDDLVIQTTDALIAVKGLEEAKAKAFNEATENTLGCNVLPSVTPDEEYADFLIDQGEKLDSLINLLYQLYPWIKGQEFRSNLGNEPVSYRNPIDCEIRKEWIYTGTTNEVRAAMIAQFNANRDGLIDYLHNADSMLKALNDPDTDYFAVKTEMNDLLKKSPGFVKLKVDKSDLQYLKKIMANGYLDLQEETKEFVDARDESDVRIRDFAVVTALTVATVGIGSAAGSARVAMAIGRGTTYGARTLAYAVDAANLAYSVEIAIDSCDLAFNSFDSPLKVTNTGIKGEDSDANLYLGPNVVNDYKACLLAVGFALPAAAPFIPGIARKFMSLADEAEGAEISSIRTIRAAETKAAAAEARIINFDDLNWRWQDSIEGSLKSAEDVLKMNKIKYTRGMVPGSKIIISPDESTVYGLLAKRFKEDYGITLIYNPAEFLEEVQRDAYIWTRRATYNPSTKEINIPTRAITYHNRKTGMWAALDNILDGPTIEHEEFHGLADVILGKHPVFTNAKVKLDPNGPNPFGVSKIYIDDGYYMDEPLAGTISGLGYAKETAKMGYKFPIGDTRNIDGIFTFTEELEDILVLGSGDLSQSTALFKTASSIDNSIESMVKGLPSEIETLDSSYKLLKVQKTVEKTIVEKTLSFKYRDLESLTDDQLGIRIIIRDTTEKGNTVRAIEVNLGFESTNPNIPIGSIEFALDSSTNIEERIGNILDDVPTQPALGLDEIPGTTERILSASEINAIRDKIINDKGLAKQIIDVKGVSDALSPKIGALADDLNVMKSFAKQNPEYMPIEDKQFLASKINSALEKVHNLNIWDEIRARLPEEALEDLDNLGMARKDVPPLVKRPIVASTNKAIPNFRPRTIMDGPVSDDNFFISAKAIERLNDDSRVGGYYGRYDSEIEQIAKNPSLRQSHHNSEKIGEFTVSPQGESDIRVAWHMQGNRVYIDDLLYHKERKYVGNWNNQARTGQITIVGTYYPKGYHPISVFKNF